MLKEENKIDKISIDEQIDEFSDEREDLDDDDFDRDDLTDYKQHDIF